MKLLLYIFCYIIAYNNLNNIRKIKMQIFTYVFIKYAVIIHTPHRKIQLNFLSPVQTIL